VVRRDVVVHEEDEPAILGLDLAQDLADFATVAAGLEVLAHGAEPAAVEAAAVELHQREGQVTLPANRSRRVSIPGWATPTGAM